MFDVARLRGELNTRLRQVQAEVSGGARTAPKRVEELVRERCGLSTVKGAVRPTDEGHVAYSNPMLGSVTNIADAIVLDQTAPGACSWLTDTVADDSTPYVCFVFSLAMGHGSGVPQPTVTFTLELEGRQVARFFVVKRAMQWVSGQALFAFQPWRVDATPFGRTFAIDETLTGESSWADGYGVLVVERSMLAAGRPNRLTLRATSELPSRHWCRVGMSSEWFPVFFNGNELAAIVAATAPAPVRRYGGQQLLLGDLHTHSGASHLIDHLPAGEGAEEACGVGSRRSMFEFARDVAVLDFFCLSEHDWQMDELDWTGLRALNDEFLRDSFTTIHGYEWTSISYGHRNVYFGDKPGSLFYSLDPRVDMLDFSVDRPSPRDLWTHLRTEGMPAITVPHHMSAAHFPLDLRDFNDADFDRVVEIYSSWGDSLEHGSPVNLSEVRIERLEFLRAIQDGYRAGFIGSSDSHDAHPGFAQGTPLRPHIFHHLGSGRAGVFVTDTDNDNDTSRREQIFTALRDRRTFAATADGLALWTSLDDDPMGSATRITRAGRFALVVDADAPLSTVTVYRNGRAAERIDVGGDKHIDTTWTEPRDADHPTDSLFVKVVRSDGETAWSSPHWLTD